MRRREYLTNIGKIISGGGIKHTYATSFLLPTIGYCKNDFNDKLINVHINNDFDDPRLLLIIDYDPSMQESLARLQQNNIYVGHTINEDEAIIEFRIPHKYHDIFNKFIKGKYSEFNNEYKQILTNINGYKVNYKGRVVTIYDAIHPRKDKIKQIADELLVDISIIKEVFDIPDLEYEIYQPIEQLERRQLHE